MNTVLNLSPEIGQVIARTFNGLLVRVEIMDVKITYGMKRYLVKVEGQQSNQIWVNA